MSSEPMFCPRCKRDDSEEQSLCHYCGERLVPEGYCGVCEAYWPLPVGTSCPKHEIELEAGDPGAVATETAGQGAARLVTVATFTQEGEAQASRIRLEAEGIPTFLEGTRMGSTAMYAVATGGVKLAVPEPLAADARVVLAQTWTPKPHDDLEDAWDDLRPEPYVARRRVMKWVLLVILFGPLLMTLIALVMNFSFGDLGNGR